ncbi:MAG: hypothetical protein HY680_05675, partial [Chloroflexi bacterium]|nr:hypothetical protein [Chloroflexota bacterium]
MQPAFPSLLQAYLASITPDTSHDARRIAFLDLLRQALGIDLRQWEVEVPLPSPSGVGRRYRGEADTLLGDLVVKFKKSLARETEDAQAQLKRYVSALHQEQPDRAFTAVATDGLHVIAYRPQYDAQGEVAALDPLGELDLSREGLDAQAAFLWLDALFNAYPNRRPATTQSVLAGLGPASPAFRIAQDGLARLYRTLGADPALALRFTQWQRYLAIVYGDQSGDTSLFLKHTYLAAVARLVAYLRLGAARLPSDADLEGILRGDYFSDRASLANFVEEDFFTWPLLEP